MTNSLNRFDVVVVKFPFASSSKYKARPAVVISTKDYNNSIRDTLIIIIAISSQIKNMLPIENEIGKWKEAGLLKLSIFKSSVATIENDSVLQRLGSLVDSDKMVLENMLDKMCLSD